jgi:hypothetical protein
MGVRTVTDAFVARIVGILNMPVDPALAIAAETFGKRWYQDAHEFANTIAQRAEISLVKAAGIVAAFSIRTHWSRNLKDTVLFLGQHTIGGLKIRVNKAQAILNLPDDASEDDVLDVLRGPKIRAFARNIIDPNGREATIDVWMARALDLPHKEFAKRDTYNAAQDAVRTVADSLGVPVPELQARIWILVRGKAE